MDSLPELEKLPSQGSSRLMVGPRKEEDVEPQQRPHLCRGIVDFLAQFACPPIHVFHFFGSVATDSY